MLDTFQLNQYTYSFKQTRHNEWTVSFSKPTKQQPVPQTVVYMKASILLTTEVRAVVEIQFLQEKMSRLVELSIDNDLNILSEENNCRHFVSRWIELQMELQDKYFDK
jgi:hypothetical protein